MTGKRITYVGDDAGSLVLIGPSTRVIDLSGKMVLPAFVDDQAHLDSHAATLGLCVALEEGTTPEEYLDLVADWVSRQPDVPVVWGRGCQPGFFPRTGPRKEDLDQIRSDIPIVPIHWGGDEWWVNS